MALSFAEAYSTFLFASFPDLSCCPVGDLPERRLSDEDAHRPTYANIRRQNNVVNLRLLRIDENDVYFTYFADNTLTIVLYNKFNVTSSSPPVSPPRHRNSDYSSAVATADYWRVVRWDEQHHVVCHSDHLFPGIVTTQARSQGGSGVPGLPSRACISGVETERRKTA